MADFTTQTRGRRTVEPTPGSYVQEPMEIDHGLDTGEQIYVWANKLEPRDIARKSAKGFVFAKYREEKTRLKDNPLAQYHYREDENGNIVYGSELVLMRGSREGVARRIREGLVQQAQAIQSAGKEDFEAQMDEWLHSTNLRRGNAPKLYTEADHGETVPLEVKEK